jgi:hypothetical protein
VCKWERHFTNTSAPRKTTATITERKCVNAALACYTMLVLNLIIMLNQTIVYRN